MPAAAIICVVLMLKELPDVLQQGHLLSRNQISECSGKKWTWEQIWTWTLHGLVEVPGEESEGGGAGGGVKSWRKAGEEIKGK